MQVLYSDIERELVERLQALNLANIEVVPMPEVEAEFLEPLRNGRVTIVYKSSDFGPVKSTGYVSQMEVLHFEVVLQAKSLRSTTGVHALGEIIKRKLVGYEPVDCSKIWMIKNEFARKEDKQAVWTYSMTIATSYLLVEDATYDEGPLLSEINITYNGDDAVIPNPANQ